MKLWALVLRRWLALPKALRAVLGVAFPVSVVVAAHAPALRAHVALSRDPGVFNDDARILIQPFWRYADPALFRDDPVSDYFLAGLPEGFRAIYVLAAKLGNPEALSKALPYVTLALLLGALYVTARKLGGAAAGWFALALAVGNAVWLSRMAGGLPRAFAYPVIALALAALATGRLRLLAVITLLGALFYPVTAAISGLAFALTLLVLPIGDRGDFVGRSLKARLAWLGVTALATAGALAPTALRLRGFGSAITPARFAEFPEAAAGGRFFADDRPPFPGFLDSALPQARDALIGAGVPWIAAARRFLDGGDPGARRELLFELVLIITLVGWARLAARDAAARRVLMLPLAAFLGHSIARLVTPQLFLPQRYVQYTVPLLAVLGVATAIASWFTRPAERRPALATVAESVSPRWVVPWRALATLALGGALLVPLGGRGSHDAGLTVRESPNEARLHAAIAALPTSAVVAGFPSSIDSVPYRARRKTLLTFEQHMPFHSGYTLTARARMRAVIAAYFATDPEPLRRLAREHGVTHLVVYPQHLRGRPPGYFKPFDADLRAALDAAQGKGFELERWFDRGGVIRENGAVVVELAKVE